MQQFSTGMNYLHMLPAHYRTVLYITTTYYFCSDPGAFFNFINRSYNTMFETITKWLIDTLFTHITGVTVIAYIQNMVFRLCNAQKGHFKDNLCR
jgi:hypothetical protein